MNAIEYTLAGLVGLVALGILLVLCVAFPFVMIVNSAHILVYLLYHMATKG